MSERNGFHDSSTSGRRFFFMGIAFFFLYLFISSELQTFIETDFVYQSMALKRSSLNPLPENFLRYFSSLALSSILWKTLLLIPAAFCFAIFLSKRFPPIFTRIIQGKKRWIPLLSAIWVFFMILFIIFFVLQKTPVTDDEQVYEFQARLLLQGKLSAQPLLASNSFNYSLIIKDANKITGHYQLGHPFFLALGIWLLRTPYLFPVLFAVFMPFLIYAIAQLLFNREAISIISALLLSMSPFFLFTSATLLGHSEAIFFLALFIWLFFLSFKTQKQFEKILLKGAAGICIGLVFNTRPLTAMAFAIPIMLFSIFQILKRKDRDYSGYAAMLVGGLLLLSVTLWYNHYISGSYFTFPYQKYNGFEKIGFGPIISNYSHTLMKGINNGTIRLLKFIFFSFGSPIGFFFLLPYMVKKKWIKEEKILFGLILAVVIIHIFYYGAGVSDTGPVYFYELLIPFTLLSGRGAILAHDYLTKKIRNGRRFIPWFLVITSALCYATFFPEQAITLRNLTTQINEPYRLVKKNNIHRAVIFIYSLPQVGWAYNPPIYLPGSDPDIIYCFLKEGPVNEKVLAAFPNRSYYIISFDGNKSTLYHTTPEILTKLKKN
jgi:hypothetical protein